MLLQLALTLLLAVQGNPYVTPEIRAQAIFVANIAISAAIEEQRRGVETVMPLVAQVPSCQLKAEQYQDKITVEWDSVASNKAELFWETYPGRVHAPGDDMSPKPKYTFTDSGAWHGQITTNAEWRTGGYNGNFKIHPFTMTVYGEGGENGCSVTVEKQP